MGNSRIEEKMAASANLKNTKKDSAAVPAPAPAISFEFLDGIARESLEWSKYKSWTTRTKDRQPETAAMAIRMRDQALAKRQAFGYPSFISSVANGLIPITRVTPKPGN